MSTFAINDPTPSWNTKLAISSTDTYDREHKTGSMPSLTLAPIGKDRSVINLHLPVLWPLGITPKQLIWRGGSGSD